MTLDKKMRCESYRRDLIHNNVQRVHPAGRVVPCTGVIRCPRCLKSAEIVFQSDPLAKQGRGNFIICSHCGYHAARGLRQIGNAAGHAKAMRRMANDPEIRRERRR